jgi:glyoxylate reductase
LKKVLRPRVWITGRVDQIPELETLHDLAEVVYRDVPGTIDWSEYLAGVPDFDAIMSVVHARFDEAVAERVRCGGRLKAFVNRGVGVDHINLQFATSLGVAVSNTPGVLVNATADHVVGLIIAGCRLYYTGIQLATSGQWTTGWASLVGQPVYGKTLGIIGLGQVGRRVAKTMRFGFDMRVLYWSRNRKLDAERELGVEYVEKDELLRQADVVSLGCSLTPETRCIIGRRELAMMKPTSVLVNAARGPLVDPAALYEAVDTEQIFAAALDCVEPEPPSADDRILHHPRIFFQPHTGSGDVASREAMTRMAVENVLDVINGRRLRNILNPEVYAAPNPRTK